MLLSVKMVFSDTPPDFLDLGAPTLGAEQFTANGVTHWQIWCRYCDEWHQHGPGEGHRIAHFIKETPYSETGYNLALKCRDA